jgi:UDP-N-acetylmuramate-alanine ligase
MKKSLFSLALVLFLGGCSGVMPTGNVGLNQNDTELVASLNHAADVIKGSVVKRANVYMYPTNSHQFVFEADDSKNLIVLELVDLDVLYRYNYLDFQNIYYIFNANSVNYVAEQQGLNFYQVILSNNKTLNLIMQMPNDDTLSFSYGYSDAQFKAIIEKLKLPMHQQGYNPDVLILDNPEHAILSEWTPQLQITDNMYILANQLSN